MSSKPLRLMVLCLLVTSFCLLERALSSGLVNVALNKPVKQIGNEILKGTLFSPFYAVDGGTMTNIESCSHTKGVPLGVPRWWIVDLQKAYEIHSVVITNRDKAWNRLRDFYVEVYSQNPLVVTSARRKLCFHYPGSVADGATVSLTCYNQPIRGRYVRVVKGPHTEEEVLTLCEFQVMASVTSSPLTISNFFELLSDRKAPGDVINQMMSQSRARCLAYCSLNPSCTAVNVGPPQEGTGGDGAMVCELLDYGGLEGVNSTVLDEDWNVFVMTF